MSQGNGCFGKNHKPQNLRPVKMSGGGPLATLFQQFDPGNVLEVADNKRWPAQILTGSAALFQGTAEERTAPQYLPSESDVAGGVIQKILV